MLSALLGGILIGVAASILWLGTRRVAGVSGIVANALQPDDGRRSERLAFLAGLVFVGAAFRALQPETASVAAAAGAPLGVIALAGLLVGLGTRLGSGCTSGHGVCGLSRFSTRSLVAVLTFMATGAITVFVVTRLFPGWRVAP